MKVECESFAEALQARFDGELAEAEREPLEKHLAGCEDCRRALEELSRLKGAFAEFSLGMKVSEGLADGVAAALPKQAGRQPVSRIVGGFEVLGRIGQGAMGTVYKARQLSMDRTVALKILPLSLARDSSFTERFVREARMAASVNHENIIQGIDAGSFGNYYYIAMEYVDGPTVYQMLEERGRLDEKEAVEITLQMLSALAHAWKNGMVHRDVKPDNIMIASDGTAKLCDLGLAKPASGGADVTQDGYVVGTPHYISPEQARGEAELDVRSDIYSLGATLFRMVTGNRPFEGDSPAEIMAKHLREPLPDPRKLAPVSAGLSGVIRRMMAKDRNARYGSPEEAARDLRALKAGTLVLKEPPAKVTRARRRIERKTSRGYVFALAAAAAALVAVGVFFSLPREEEGKKKGPRPRASAPGKDSGEPSEAEAVYKHILAAYEKNPEDYEFHLRRIDEHLDELKQTPFAGKLSELRERIVRAREEEASRELARVREVAETLAGKNDFAGAVDALKLPASLANARAAGELASIRERMEKRAEETWARFVSSVREAVKRKDFKAARDASKSLPKLPRDRSADLEELASRIDGAERAERARVEGLAAREARRRFEERTGSIVDDFCASRFERVKRACERLASLSGVSPDEKAVLRGYAALASDALGVSEAALDALALLSESEREFSEAGLSGRIKDVDRESGQFLLVKALRGGGVVERPMGLKDLAADALTALAVESLVEEAILAGELKRGDPKARKLAHVRSERTGTIARWSGAFSAAAGELERARSAYSRVRAADDVLAALRDLLVRRTQLAAGKLHGEVEVTPEGLLEVRYDFSSPEQLRDFQAHTGPGSGEGSWGIRGGKLVSEGAAGLATKLEFTDFELRVTYGVTRGDGVALGIASEGELDALVAGFAGRTYLEQWKGGLPRLLGEPQALPAGSGGEIELARRGRELVARTSAGELRAGGVSDRRARAVLLPADGEVAFEELILRGRPVVGARGTKR